MHAAVNSATTCRCTLLYRVCSLITTVVGTNLSSEVQVSRSIQVGWRSGRAVERGHKLSNNSAAVDRFVKFGNCKGSG